MLYLMKVLVGTAKTWARHQYHSIPKACERTDAKSTYVIQFFQRSLFRFGNEKEDQAEGKDVETAIINCQCDNKDHER